MAVGSSGRVVAVGEGMAATAVRVGWSCVGASPVVAMVDVGAGVAVWSRLQEASRARARRSHRLIIRFMQVGLLEICQSMR